MSDDIRFVLRQLTRAAHEVLLNHVNPEKRLLALGELARWTRFVEGWNKRDAQKPVDERLGSQIPCVREETP